MPRRARPTLRGWEGLGDVVRRLNATVLGICAGLQPLVRFAAAGSRQWRTEGSEIQATAAPERRWWGTQFHLERSTRIIPDGRRVLANFFRRPALPGLRVAVDGKGHDGQNVCALDDVQCDQRLFAPGEGLPITRKVRLGRSA